MNKLYAGIDVHSKTNYVYLMKPDGSKHSSFSVKNNPDGSKKLTDKIVAALTSLNISDVVIGVEATGVYGENLMIYLREESSLNLFDCDYHVLNPKQVKKFKESYSDLPKNDPVDAFVIADNLRFGRITKPLYIDDGYKYKALQTLTRARFFAVQNLTREKQRFANYLLPLNNSINQVISVSIANIRAMKEPVKSFDKAIEKQLVIIPNSKSLLSIKGVGQVYTAGIISEIGDINRFANHAALAKYAGISWSEHKFGNFTGEITNLVKSGNRYLRYYLLEAADSLRKCDSEFRRFYDLKFHEVNRFQHKRALALTARKLIRLVFRLLKDNRLYTPPELFKR